MARATWERVIREAQSPLKLAFQAKNLLFEVKLKASQSIRSGWWEFWRTLPHSSRINNTEIQLFFYYSFLWWFACWLPVCFLETFLSPLLPKTKHNQSPHQTAIIHWRQSKELKAAKEALCLLPMLTVPARKAFLPLFHFGGRLVLPSRKLENMTYW